MRRPVTLSGPGTGERRQLGSGPGGAPSTPLAQRASAEHGFSVALARERAPPAGAGPTIYEIRPGDTLSQIALDRLKSLGLPHSGQAVMQAVAHIAQANGLADPDRIFAGSRIRLDVPGPQALPQQDRVASQSGVRRSAATAAPPVLGASPPARAPLTVGLAAGQSSRAHFPVLERTLDRAVQNGYLPSADRVAIREKILAMASKYRFSPDDFATVALMESDGLNPRASNGRCFGIIQFCGGPQAGAAAVGLSGSAATIVDRPVVEQLELVDRYFEHNGLQRLPQVGLVDLYLTILTPAARSERSPVSPLPIPGVQARALHENQDRSRPITRTSIVSGLLDHARQLLAGRVLPSAKPDGKPGGNILPLARQQLPLQERSPGGRPG